MKKRWSTKNNKQKKPMSDIIKLLPDSVANQIAAGEVIQRPASVIKELVENSVDAGATEIRIYIKDAGRTLIQVVDNGKGMSDTDARMAFERHATSKIRGADDLFTLRTMGFRGEALPSVCAISQLEIMTRQPDAAIGTRLVINGSQVEVQEPCVCDAGTNIMVKNIFYNVPARRKFLKSDNVELSNIMREFERLALVNNNVRMSIDTGNRNLDLRAASLKQRIADIWKNNLDLHLIPIEVDTSLIRISGYISRPESARRRNPLQYLIVNGRNMRHPYFHRAIMNCYEPLIASDTQPCYFLKFEVDPSSIDVNIHPTKNEIKFEYEQEIWPILQASVKAALGKFGAVPGIDFNSDVLPVDPLRNGETPERPTLDITEGYNPFGPRQSGGTTREFGRDATPRNWESLYSDFMRGAHGFAEPAPETEPQATVFGTTPPEPAIGAVCMQHGLKYILTNSREGLMIIDQHRAHVKVLYQKYLTRLQGAEQASQPVMFPELVAFDEAQQSALQDARAELSHLGFNLEYEEENRWRMVSVPAVLNGSDARDTLLRVLDTVDEGGENFGKEGAVAKSVTERLALAAARSAAIKRGQRLSVDEMEHLTGELFALPDPQYTPNGNRIYKVIDDDALTAMFR